MLGPAHSATGLAAGALTLPLIPVHDVPSQLAYVAVMGGAAYLPDLDGNGATAARSWGFLTRWFATGIGFIAGGHRNRTHDLILAPVVFGAAVYLASRNQWTSLIVIALAIGLAVEAVGRILPGDWKSPGLNFLFSTVAAYALIQAGYDWSWLPIAAVLGVVVHIFGDSVTVAGCPVPLTTFSKRRPNWGLRLFEAGNEKIEKWVIRVSLAVCVAATAWFVGWPYLSKLIPGLHT